MTPLLSLLSFALTAAPDGGTTSALGSPRDDLAPPAIEKPHPDSAVLRALVAAFEPTPVEIRIIAIENLGLHGDARVIDPLAALVLDPDLRIATAAIRSIGRFPHPRAEEVLSNVVRQPKLPDALKVSAIEQLVFQRRPSARAFLEETGKSRTPSVSVQHAAREAALRWGNAPTPAGSRK